MTSTGELQSLLECPVCLHAMYPPIYQCSNGHALCSDCLARVQNRCPLCREVLGSIRCLALENLGELVKLPCRFENWGCQESFTSQDRLEHERDCTFRPYSCPYAQCPMENCDIQFIIEHLKKDHVIDLRGSTFNLIYVVPGHTTWISALRNRPMLVFHCFDHHFCLHFQPIPSGLLTSTGLIFLRFMGEDCQAMRFRYCVGVNGNGKKFFWRGVPTSIRESHETVRETAQGLFIYRDLPDYNPLEDIPREMLELSICIWEEPS